MQEIGHGHLTSFYLYAAMHVGMNICMYVYRHLYASMYVYENMCMYYAVTCMPVCMRVYVCLHVCIS